MFGETSVKQLILAQRKTKEIEVDCLKGKAFKEWAKIEKHLLKVLTRLKDTPVI